MPPTGRELHDLRAAAQALADRYPQGRRKSLDDDVRAVLGLADDILGATEPGGRGDDGEASPGQRAWHRAAAGLADSDDGTYNQAAEKMRGKGDGYKIGHLGSERGKRRGAARSVYDLEDT